MFTECPHTAAAGEAGPELASNGCASQPLWGECWLPSSPFSSDHVKLGCHVFAFLCGYAIILLG